MHDLDSVRIAVLGLGYVGLPLAVEFGKHFRTVGFDINADRVASLRRGEDSTRESTSDELASSKNLVLSSQLDDIRDCQVYIVAVPTPIDRYNRPDLGALLAASRTVGQVISPGAVVIYESTVYPGATEEDCVPIVESVSGLKFNRDFYAGYSPERINPGDKQHTLTRIVKVVSGSTPATADFVATLYGSIITAGLHKASSIRVAEAAKVIENTQRDLNIALINELALIFERMNIDTAEVLAAAGTKWNFLPFRPGLVGGHCISVDPYYLTHKAQEIGYHPEVILAGRRINDSMGTYVAERVIKLMLRKSVAVVGARVLVLGFAFKENCPDVRNTRVIDIVRELQSCNVQVDVHDPWVSAHEMQEEYGIAPIAKPEANSYDAVILAVAHNEFRALGATGIKALAKPRAVIFDVQSALPRDAVDGRL